VTVAGRAGLLVFGTALAVRLGVLLGMEAPILQPYRADAAEYHAYAVSLSQTGVYMTLDQRRASRMPGYSIFLAALYKLFGTHHRWVAAAAQALLGALSCVLLWALARAAMTPGWALACGLFSSICWDLILPGLSLLSEAFAIFLILAFVWVLRHEKPGWTRKGAALGVATGFLFLTRAEIGLAAGLAVLFARLDRKTLLSFAAAGALTVAPWLVRNYALFHRFMPGTSASAASLYIGVFGTIRDGLKAEVPGLTLEMAPAATPEGELSGYYKQKTTEFYAKVPRSLLLRALTFNAAILFYPFLPEYDATFVFLLPFIAYSLTLWRRKPEIRPLIVFAAALIGQYLLAGQTVSRYRFNLAPLFILLGFTSLSSRTWPKGALAGWAAFNAAGAVFAPHLRAIALSIKGALWRA
jgi:hypothetical protein